MQQRNLLHTALTRAQRIVVLVGSRRTLAKAVRAQGAGRRYTALTNGYSRDGRSRLNRFRSSPRSESAVGSGRQNGQSNAMTAHRLGHSGVPDEG